MTDLTEDYILGLKKIEKDAPEGAEQVNIFSQLKFCQYYKGKNPSVRESWDGEKWVPCDPNNSVEPLEDFRSLDDIRDIIALYDKADLKNHDVEVARKTLDTAIDILAYPIGDSYSRQMVIDVGELLEYIKNIK